MSSPPNLLYRRLENGGKGLRTQMFIPRVLGRVEGLLGGALEKGCEGEGWMGWVELLL